MRTHVEAIFENGAFRPLQPLSLPEHQRVTVTLEPPHFDEGHKAQFVLSEDRWQAFCDALDAPPKEIPALKKLLSEPSLFDGDGKSAS